MIPLLVHRRDERDLATAGFRDFRGQVALHGGIYPVGVKDRLTHSRELFICIGEI